MSGTENNSPSRKNWRRSSHGSFSIAFLIIAKNFMTLFIITISRHVFIRERFVPLPSFEGWTYTLSGVLLDLELHGTVPSEGVTACRRV